MTLVVGVSKAAGSYSAAGVSNFARRENFRAQRNSDYVNAVLCFYISTDYRQVVRHAVLIRIYAGSNPASPVGRVQDRYVRYDSNIPTPGSAWSTESLLYMWCKSTVSRLLLLRRKTICKQHRSLSASRMKFVNSSMLS